jgi:phenylacetate-CoA ligase
MRRWLAWNAWFPLQERLKGHATLSILRDMEAADRLDPADLRALQARKLRALLDYSYRHVPYVRRVMLDAGIGPDEIRDASDLPLLPVLTKADVRTHRSELRSDVAVQLASFTTGGSTGQPLVFELGKDRVASRIACRLRVGRWWGVSIGDPEVAVWGSPIELTRQDRLRSLRDWFLATRLLSAFDMTDNRMTEYLDVIERQRCTQLFGYPSAIHLLCLHARKLGRDLRGVGVRVAFVTGEMLLPHQREIISETFNCAVADGYGGRDSGFLAHECPAGGMHVMSDAVIVEIVDREGRPVPPGDTGEIVATDLYSRDAPFIRYSTGDMGALSARACSCGRPHALLERIEGRANDLIVAPDGRMINALALAYPLRETAGIEQFQIVQNTVASFDVQIACSSAFDRNSEERIRAAWCALLRAPIDVSFRYVPRVASDAHGKFRHIVSRVSLAAAGAADTAPRA